MRLVEGRVDEDQIALAAADDPHVILLELERLVGTAACRARAAREQLLRYAAEPRDEVVDWMRPLLDEALVRAARTQPADVDGLVFGHAPVGNFHGSSGYSRTPPRNNSAIFKSAGASMSSDSSALMPSGHDRSPYSDPPLTTAARTARTAGPFRAKRFGLSWRLVAVGPSRNGFRRPSSIRMTDSGLNWCGTSTTETTESAAVR